MERRQWYSIPLSWKTMWQGALEQHERVHDCYFGIYISSKLFWFMICPAEGVADCAAQVISMMRSRTNFPRNRPTIKKILFAVTRPTQKNGPYSKNCWSSWKRFFFISSSQILFFSFFSIFLQKWWECALVNRGATGKKMNWNKCHSILQIHIKISPIPSS